jgi:hypothetical protein
MKLPILTLVLAVSVGLPVATVSAAPDPTLYRQIAGAVILADLKSFFHGTPPPAPKLPPDAKAATVSFAPGTTPDKQILDFMLAFAEAARVHDGASLKSRLSDKYIVEDMPSEHAAADFFMQAMARITGPEEIVINSVEPQGDVRVAKMEFRSANRPVKLRIFKFDAAGKLLSADFFRLERHEG